MRSLLRCLCFGTLVVFSSDPAAAQPPQFDGFLRVHPLGRALDSDGDGQISAEELAGSVSVLKSLDRDGDGVVSGRELMPDFAALQRENAPREEGRREDTFLEEPRRGADTARPESRRDPEPRDADRRPEQMRPPQSRPESRSENDRPAEPRRQQARPEFATPDQFTPDQSRPDQRGPDQRGPDQSGPDQRGPDQRGPDQRGPDQRGPDQRGPDQRGPDQRGPDQRGPDQRGPDQREQEQRDRPLAGPQESGPGGAGPHGPVRPFEKQRFGPPFGGFPAPFAHGSPPLAMSGEKRPPFGAFGRSHEPGQGIMDSALPRPFAVIFKLLDQNHDGSLSRDEFLKLEDANRGFAHPGMSPAAHGLPMSGPHVRGPGVHHPGMIHRMDSARPPIHELLRQHHGPGRDGITHEGKSPEKAHKAIDQKSDKKPPGNSKRGRHGRDADDDSDDDDADDDDADDDDADDDDADDDDADDDDADDDDADDDDADDDDAGSSEPIPAQTTEHIADGDWI